MADELEKNLFQFNRMQDKEIFYGEEQPKDILKASLDYINEGFEVLPMTADKNPDVQRVNKIRQNPISEHNAHFWWPDAPSIAIFTGGKKRIECIDFEPVFVKSGLYQKLLDFIKYTYPEIFAKLTIEETASGGIHWYYTCTRIGGKQELAARAPVSVEKQSGESKVLLIESIGQDRWINVYPSDGYKQLQNDLLLVQEIESEEREIIIGLCKEYNELHEVNTFGIPKNDYTNPQAVWNVFNERNGLQWTTATLQDAGFEILQDNGERVYVRRPGKTMAKHSGSIHKESNVLFLFTTSSVLPAGKPLRPFDIELHLKYDGNFIECCNALVKQGYGQFNIEQSFEVSFFDVKRLKKGLQYTVNRTRFINFLNGHGVGLYRPDNKTYVYTRAEGHPFQEITVEDMKKICLLHLDGLCEVYDCGATKREMIETFLKGVDSYFSKNLLECLPRFEPNLLRDTREACYLPFKNGVIKITADGPVLLTYAEVGCQIWKDAIIDHEIRIDDIVAYCEWSRFYACICGTDSPDNLTEEQTSNFFYLCALTGYLIHKYKDPARGYAVIFSEAVESDEKGGGTGKGLFCKGLEKMTPTCFISGKTFDPVVRFAWQRLQLFHSVAVIDDVQKNFNFQGLYNAITDGLTLERKNQQEIFINYDDSPKIVVISNYVISNIGNHAERRQKTFEFAPFFGPAYTPEKHFGHLLLKDWDNQEWNRFYNFMISCTANYLKEGIPTIGRSGTLQRRAIQQKYGVEFSEWFYDQYLANGCENWQGVTDLHEQFLKFAEIEKTDFSVKKFKAAILSSTLSQPCPQVQDVETRRNKNEGNRNEIRLKMKIRDSIQEKGTGLVQHSGQG